MKSHSLRKPKAISQRSWWNLIELQMPRSLWFSKMAVWKIQSAKLNRNRIAATENSPNLISRLKLSEPIFLNWGKLTKRIRFPSNLCKLSSQFRNLHPVKLKIQVTTLRKYSNASLINWKIQHLNIILKLIRNHAKHCQKGQRKTESLCTTGAEAMLWNLASQLSKIGTDPCLKQPTPRKTTPWRTTSQLRIRKTWGQNPRFQWMIIKTPTTTLRPPSQVSNSHPTSRRPRAPWSGTVVRRIFNSPQIGRTSRT